MKPRSSKELNRSLTSVDLKVNVAAPKYQLTSVVGNSQVVSGRSKVLRLGKLAKQLM